MSLFSALESDSAAYTRSNLSDMIFLSAFIQDDSSVKITENKTLYYYLGEIRNNIKSTINAYLDKDQGGIAIAMLIGDTSYLTEDVRMHSRPVVSPMSFRYQECIYLLYLCLLFICLEKLSFQRN